MTFRKFLFHKPYFHKALLASLSCIAVLAAPSIAQTPIALAESTPAEAAETAINAEPKSAWSYLLPLAEYPRPAGSPKEQKAADWIAKQWQSQGYNVSELPFEFTYRKTKFSSQNLVIDIKGQSEKVLIIGAHYDSTGHLQGSRGVADNASGTAAILALAGRLQGKSLPFSLRLIAFGAEEVGLQGAKAYVNQQWPVKDRENVIAMINLDTIIGGDKLYVHSAHTTPYKCKGQDKVSYNSDTQVRDGLKQVSELLFAEQAHQLHPAYDGYPEGVTGSWSDHSPFACAGVAIAYLEATNFAIDGENGNDGYSQTEKPALWDCYDGKNKTACDRKKEKSWGKIWHTKFDRLDALEPQMPGRLQQQLKQNIDVLEKFVLTADTYLK